ncbi:MAG TPA: MerR family transcriptional regulator [Ramlibacter sp.]|nr:MerR family transcriptional regulator [Ramlibacter sp.]
MLTSKDIIERTGISRATLNNYIGSGLVPRPQVLAPGPLDGDAPRIGYFPDDTVARVETIQRLKRDGWSISRIAEMFAGQGPGAAATPTLLGAVFNGAVHRPTPPTPPVAVPPSQAPSAPLPPASPTFVAPDPLLRTGGLAHAAAPTLTTLAVMCTTLQDAAGLWVRLTAQEYFELVNEVWAELDPLFRRHRGRAGRHPDEGMVGYFQPQRDSSHLWNALAAAHQAREAIRQLSLRWQARKGWDVELSMNTGIDEGQDWMGTLGPAGAGELRVLGDTSDCAEQLSRSSRPGSILVTRKLLGQLPSAERERLAYGVPRAPGSGPESHLLFSFARLADLAPGTASLVPLRFADVAVAELLDLQGSGAAPRGAA